MLAAILESIKQSIIENLNQSPQRVDKESFFAQNWEQYFFDFDDWMILFCSAYRKYASCWIYPMLSPNKNLDTLKKQLPKFSFNQAQTGFSWVSSEDKDWIEPYWRDSGGFEESDHPLFFHKQYFGYPKGEDSYFEFNQLVTHILGLHKSRKSNAYCRLDSLGAEIELIKIIDVDDIELIVVKRRVLEHLLYLGDWSLVRYFDIRQFSTEFPCLIDHTSEEIETEEGKFKFVVNYIDGEFVQVRGAQIFRSDNPNDGSEAWAFYEDEETRYESFVIQDWKNGKILEEYSIDPTNFANYFVESDLPFETSPVFFKAEVLDKYKNNPDRYDLEERSIYCRGGWFLKTYDINEHSQVHTYATYLASLPYREQLHWKQYNEKPKGTISKRSLQTDFKGEFCIELSKLEKLKEALELLKSLRIRDEDFAIWSPKGGSWEVAGKGLYQVVSENPNQWHDFIIALANATNEGFLKKPLKRIASKLGGGDEQLGTLGLIKFIMQNTGFEDKISIIHTPLNDLQIRRGKGKAHGSWEIPNCSLIQDADQRLDQVTNAINEMTVVFGSIELPN